MQIPRSKREYEVGEVNSTVVDADSKHEAARSLDVPMNWNPDSCLNILQLFPQF
jgi:hypothetical protein